MRVPSSLFHLKNQNLNVAPFSKNSKNQPKIARECLLSISQVNEFLELPPFQHPNPLKSFNRTKQVIEMVVSLDGGVVYFSPFAKSKNRKAKFTTRETSFYRVRNCL